MPLRFTAEQWVAYDVEHVFSFFANPANLPRLMPAWQATRIERITLVPARSDSTSTLGIAAGSGTRILLSARILPLLPLRATWDALIENFRPNEGFCDVQLRGPFRYWRHCHTVTPEQSGGGQPGTRIRDEITYDLPLDVLSAFADRLLVRQLLAATFRFRHQRTLALLPSWDPAGFQS